MKKLNTRTTSMKKALLESAKIQNGEITFKLADIDGFKEQDEAYKDSIKFRNDLVTAVASVVTSKAPGQFEEDEELQRVHASVKFGGVQHDINAHREWNVPNEEGEEVTYTNFLTVENDDNFGGGIALVRELSAEIVESDELEEEAVEETA